MNTNTIKVSIVTPSFNQGQFIEKTILSVLNQTYKNIEYIIYDSCSNDCTNDILNKYSDKISNIYVERDKGQSDAINKGFKKATGEIIAWINSDDVLYPDCVEKIVNAYQKNINASIFYNSRCDIINGNSVVIGEINREISGKEYLLNFNYEVLQPGSFYNSNILKKVNYLNEKLHYCMDLDLWLNLLSFGPIVDLKTDPICAYREWELTKTSTGAYRFYWEIIKTLKFHGSSIVSQSLRNAIKFFVKSLIKNIT
jgi:glycosyltransferase involved in cell wall biosynthesis